MSFIPRERRRVAKRSRIREIVFGSQDGITTTLGVVSSMYAATHSNSIIIIAGASAAVAGMFSMAAGAYLSSRAEADVHRSEIARERKKIHDEPEHERAEVSQIYSRQGVPPRLASSAAEAVIRKPRKALELMTRIELGINSQRGQKPIKDAALTGGSFLIAGVIPLLPFLFLHGALMFWLAIALGFAMLFLSGIFKGVVSGSPRARSGLETFGIGAAAAALGFLVGTVIPRALGVHSGLGS